jgi:hypothetical protein
MDRRIRTVAGLGLMLAVSGTACRTPRSEIPPAKTFSASGQPAAPLAFGSSPNNNNGFSTLSSVTGDGRPAHDGAGTIGTPAPRSDNYGAPTTGAYGAPGSAMGNSPTMAPSSYSNPGVGIPQNGTGPTGPAAGIGAPPSGAAPAQMPAPGQGLFNN